MVQVMPLRLSPISPAPIKGRRGFSGREATGKARFRGIRGISGLEYRRGRSLERKADPKQQEMPAERKATGLPVDGVVKAPPLIHRKR